MNNGRGSACGCVCVLVCKSGMILGTFGQNVTEVHLAGRGGFQCWNPPPWGGGSSEMDPGTPPFWLLEGGVPVTNLVAGTPFLEVPGGSSDQITPPRRPLHGVRRTRNFAYYILGHTASLAPCYLPTRAIGFMGTKNGQEPLKGGVPRHDLPGDTSTASLGPAPH